MIWKVSGQSKKCLDILEYVSGWSKKCPDILENVSGWYGKCPDDFKRAVLNFAYIQLKVQIVYLTNVPCEECLDRSYG